MTLIEILIALSLSAIVVVSLSGAFNSGIRSYRRTDQILRRREPFFRFFVVFADDLRELFPYSVTQCHFKGDASRIEFFTLKERWEKELNGKIKRTSPHFARVVYFFKQDKIYRNALFRGDALKEIPVEQGALIFLDDVKMFHLTYGYLDKDTSKEIVSESWSNPLKMPDWLEIEMRTGGDGIFKRKFYLS